jgi:exopolysaccharide biosynthesis polyprenyl glycosylphosphotransferase
VAGAFTQVPAVARRERWQRVYARRLVLTDVASVVVACFLSELIWIGNGARSVAHGTGELTGVSYTLVTLGFIVGWLILLAVSASRDHTVIGAGTLEYRKIVESTIAVFGTGAALAYLFQAQLGRGYFLTIVPLGLILLLSSRWAWRQWLNRARRSGHFTSRTLLLGQSRTARQFAQTILNNNESGLQLVGAVLGGVTGTIRGDLVPGVPVLGHTRDILNAVLTSKADTLVVSDTHGLSHEEFRRLGWDLEQLDVKLVVAPAITDVAGPRIHSRPVAGLPLIYIDFPTLSRRKAAVKRGTDIIGSAVLLLLASPVLLVVGAAVKFTSRGPLFYRQERIGQHGEPFHMIKFRSMVQGADDKLQSLLDAQGTSDKPLFKINNDPRITPVGRVIRKYSLDELPQLLNVFKGDMSLVGPRPQVPKEVALYDDDAHRRHIMKPGMSGLWQVSGRSRLSWDDAIRLDLYYVENWSLTGDLAILWRTIKVVALGDGAV